MVEKYTPCSMVEIITFTSYLVTDCCRKKNIRTVFNGGNNNIHQLLGDRLCHDRTKDKNMVENRYKHTNNLVEVRKLLVKW